MSKKEILLTVNDVQAHADGIEEAQKVLLNAILDWKNKCHLAKEAGLALEIGDSRNTIYPIKHIDYTPHIRVVI